MSQKDAFVKPFVGVIAVLVVISVVLFIIARSFGTGAPEDQTPDPRAQAATDQRIQPFGTVEAGKVESADAGAGEPRSGQQIVKNTCAACHASGVQGAPVIGEQGDWSARLDKGADSLLQNATNGLNAMPPKGGDASLSEDELKGAIGYMLAESGLDDPFAGGASAASGGDEKKAEEAPAQAAADEGADAGGADLAKGKQVYQATCFACHGTGAAGAPKTGDAGAWEDRIAQGKDTLYTHAIEGFQGDAGVMPAKGGNPSLSDEDVKAAVDYMVSEAQ